MKTKAYKIDWIDSFTTHGWRHPDSIDFSNCKCQTIGYYVREDNKSITLAQNKGVDDKDFGDYMTIPKSVIKKKRIIKV